MPTAAVAAATAPRSDERSSPIAAAQESSSPDIFTVKEVVALPTEGTLPRDKSAEEGMGTGDATESKERSDADKTPVESTVPGKDAGDCDRDAFRRDAQRNQPSTAPPDNHNQYASPLPEDLRLILEEVARTGVSSRLPWVALEKPKVPPPEPRKKEEGASPLSFMSQRSGGPHKRNHSFYSNNAGTNLSLKRARLSQKGHGTQHMKAGRNFGGSSASAFGKMGNRNAGQTTVQVVTQQPRKQMNGVHTAPSKSFTDCLGSIGRKRSLLHTGSFAGSSGRASGSEAEDTSQYDCDSEGTSVTSMSDLSFDQGRHDSRVSNLSLLRAENHPAAVAKDGSNLYASLRDAVRASLSVVLDYYYEKKGGYKLSQAELSRIRTSEQKTDTGDNGKREHDTDTSMSYKDALLTGDSNPMRSTTQSNANFSSGLGVAQRKLTLKTESKGTDHQEMVFQQRKRRLLDVLGGPRVENKALPSTKQAKAGEACADEPPFTIQRIAEVLVSPERFYTQTHKLCNSLEKLLLVTTPMSVFGDTREKEGFQRPRDESERSYFSDQAGRQKAAFRKNRRRRKRTPDSPLSVDLSKSDQEAVPSVGTKQEADQEGGAADDMQEEDDLFRELSTARASLRTKFDHMGIDPHSAIALSEREIRALETRSLTNSPPLPGPGIQIPGGPGTLLRAHGPGSPVTHGRASPTSPPSNSGHPSPFSRLTSSPILFGHARTDGISPVASLHATHFLQMHHAATLAGLSPLELMALGSESAAGAPGILHGLSPRDPDVESRSSASSDFDSESDVSFDDSASDRSVGSESGQQHEPLAAASRAMMLNRTQPQQRRMLTSLQQQGESESAEAGDASRSDDSGGNDPSSSNASD